MIGVATSPRTTTSPATPGVTGQRRVLVLAAAGAVSAAGVGLLTVTVFVLLGWVTDARSGSGLAAALRVAGQLWLSAHGTSIGVPGGWVRLMPLGLTAVVVILLARVAGSVVRTHPPETLRQLLIVVAALACPYAALAAAVSKAAASAQVSPAPLTALAGAGSLAAIVAAGAGYRVLAVEQGRHLLDCVRAALRGAAAGAGVVLGGGAFCAGLSLAMHLRQAGSTAASLGPGWVGGVVLLVWQLALVPTAVIWGAAYLAGPGFAVGAGTSVSIFGVSLGAVPAVPLLAALPADGPSPWALRGLLLVPLAAGVIAGLVTDRAAPASGPGRAALAGLGCGLGAATVLALAALMADGPAGPGRLATVGPSPWRVGLAAVAEIGVPAATTAWLMARRRAQPVARYRDLWRKGLARTGRTN